MAFDGITLYSVIKELQVLVDGKVNQIYEPTSNNIYISIYNKKTYALNIDTTANNYRLHLTTHSSKNPIQAPNFCMILRKYLVSSKIKKIYMNGLERICYIDFECFNEMNDKVVRTLAIELMGKYSNVVLLNENNTIIDALKKYDSEGKSRDIMPGRKYILPISDKKDLLNISFDEFNSLVTLSGNKTLESTIPNVFAGVSKSFIQSAIDYLHLSNTISATNLKDIYDYVMTILSEDSDCFCDAFKKGYSIYLITSSVSDDNISDFEVNFFLDDFYYSKSEEESYIAYRNNLLKILSHTLDKLINKLNNINDKIKSCENMDKYKIYGELLIANIYRENSCNEGFIELENYYDHNSIVKIPIDNNLTIAQNAERYFKKYNKMKNTLAVVKVQKEQTNTELNYLESLIQEIDNCQNIADVDEVYDEISANILFSDLNFKNKKKSNSKDNPSMLSNYIKLQIDGYDVCVGKNNKQNDYLTLKLANDNDYWFHAKDIHGSHLILRCNGEMPKISTITKCAEICAYYSKAKYSSHVPVDYTLAKYVKKPHGSNPGYVIYTNNKTVFVDPCL